MTRTKPEYQPAYSDIKLCINRKKVQDAGGITIFIGTIILLFNIYLFYEFSPLSIQDLFSPTILAILVISWGVYALFAYLHFEYLHFSRNKQVIINTTDKLIRYTDNAGTKEIPFSEVRLISIHAGTRTVKKRWNIYNQYDDTYYYAELILNDDSRIIVTSLMSDNLYDELISLSDITFDIDITLFSSIRFTI